MNEARILLHLVLPKENRKLSDSNILGNLLKLYKVESERFIGTNMRDERTIKMLDLNINQVEYYEQST